jgi:hypothetical protein
MKDDGTSIREIRRSLHEIYERCVGSVAAKAVPGEGGERALRGWIINPFLTENLGWPPEHIVQGERFDLLLRDSESFNVVYIETKAPGRVIPAKEREDFEKRIHAYGSIRAAFLTDGRIWERLDIIAPKGSVTIHKRVRIDLEKCGDEEAEAFFLPLAADRYLPGEGRTGKLRVSKDHPHTLESLASDLDECVHELSEFYEALFADLENGDLGPRVRDVTIDLFNRWCHKSLVVPLRKAAETVRDGFGKGISDPEDVAKILRDLGFSGECASEAADALAALKASEKEDEDKVLALLFPLYQGQVAKLAAQTAHVSLARILVYRIGEDQKVFPVEMSGNALRGLVLTDSAGIGADRHPALSSIHRTRERLENFLPSVYKLGEFDWWWVPRDKRALLAGGERGRLDAMESDHEVILKRTLNVLNGYYFGDVDVDVWRNVYQHYLPDEERQKLGGFYTPDELVDFILDLGGYVPEDPDLSKRTFIDAACGSGAFVTGALSRLLRHFETGMPGARSFGDGRTPDWKRSEAVLRVVERNLHAVDIHPFAAFLTTINVMFLLLPHYVRARRHNPEFSLDLRIFSADSLEKPDVEAIAGELFEKLNSRVQLSADAAKRYATIIGERFDYVFGNPPWGGVLKGPLAPVFDEGKKRRFRREYPHAAVGKYDIYGLFMERGLQILKPGGRLGIVTQDTFLDKEWASSLRKRLASKATVRMVVDLNPFGQLFFKAMNTPAVTIADNEPPPPDGSFLSLLSRPSGDWKRVPPDRRRQYVVGVLREAIAAAAANGKAEIDFASARVLPLETLAKTAGSRWDLAPISASAVKIEEGAFRVSDLFDPRQGVTPGGCLDLFLMDEERAAELRLEEELVHKAIKSREFERWRARHTGRVLLYPYVTTDGEAVPAFFLRGPLADALEFETPFDEREKEIRRGRALDRETLGKILAHRIAKGIVKYPNTARYLAEEYERLEGRVFKKKNIRKFGRRWYEYLWPRDASLMIGSVPRIVSPTLCRQVRFAMDEDGFLSDHACLYLFPRRGTANGIDPFIRKLSKILVRKISLEEALLYCLPFLNSPQAQERLVSGRRPTPKGYYQIGEEYLKEIFIFLPRSRAEGKAILGAIRQLVQRGTHEDVQRAETKLLEIVNGIVRGLPFKSRKKGPLQT